VLLPDSAGTPIQNTQLELFTLLKFVDPGRFREEEFMAQYGELRQHSQIEALQLELKPYLLRYDQ